MIYTWTRYFKTLGRDPTLTGRIQLWKELLKKFAQPLYRPRIFGFLVFFRGHQPSGEVVLGNDRILTMVFLR